MLDKIRKIIAKAEGTDNAAEAEMLMAKAHKLLEEHNYTLLDVAEDTDPIATQKSGTHAWTSNSWVTTLANQLAKYYGCSLVLSRTGNKRNHYVTGRESARVTFELMLPFILKQVRAAARAIQAQEGGGLGKHERRVGNELASRIFVMNRENDQREQARVARGERALVPVDMVALVEKEHFGNLSASKGRPRARSAAARNAAAGISLNRQTGSSGGQRRLS